jgi:hypothetical protein
MDPLMGFSIGLGGTSSSVVYLVALVLKGEL